MHRAPRESARLLLSGQTVALQLLGPSDDAAGLPKWLFSYRLAWGERRPSCIYSSAHVNSPLEWGLTEGWEAGLMVMLMYLLYECGRPQEDLGKFITLRRFLLLLLSIFDRNERCAASHTVSSPLHTSSVLWHLFPPPEIKSRIMKINNCHYVYCVLLDSSSSTLDTNRFSPWGIRS